MLLYSNMDTQVLLASWIEEVDRALPHLPKRYRDPKTPAVWVVLN